MKLVNKSKKDAFKLSAFFELTKIKENNLLKIKYAITEFIENKTCYIYLGKEEEFDLASLKTVINKIINLNTREFEIDAKSFVNKKNSEEDVVRVFIDRNEFINGKNLYSAKTSGISKKVELSIFSENKNAEKIAEETLFIAKSVNNARRLQAIPPNICHSEWLADEMQKAFKKHGNKVKVKVLNKKEITAEKMELFLSVNLGSSYEPRLVVAEYKGNPNSKAKTVYIGKGITFDSGGYNLKPSAHIKGMKYDMSGAAICFAAMDAIIALSPKTNISVVLPLTDNRVSSKASLPDSIYTSMNGKTVEINNTDAEGRLILADAITYAIRKLSATRIVDVATLTGAMVVALGSTYTGAWATTDQAWNDLLVASQQQDELIWRMPFHNDFLINLKKSGFADLKNTDLTGKGGSCSAAMFLKEFTENTEYIHLDIAGSGGDGDEPTGIMVKTLIQMSLNAN